MQKLSPIGWALRPLKNYANFSGRASRAEFWWFFLFMMIVWVVVYVALVGTLFGAGTTQTGPSEGILGAVGVLGLFLVIFWLAVLIPSIAVQARRLHDTDRSGWWLGAFYLLYLVYFAMLFLGMGSMMEGVAPGTPPDPQKVFGGMFIAIMILGTGMFFYMIALIVFYCLPGTQGPNRYGDDPYGANVEEVFA